MVVTNSMLNERREAGCFVITTERKFYRVDNVFIKRSLRPSEWQTSPIKGTIHIPRQGKERLRNEAAALKFIREHTNVPVPKLICNFEDNDAVYLVTEYVEGVNMNDLEGSQKEIVTQELERHLQTIHNLRSSKLGGPGGLVVPPYRVTLASFRDDWDLQSSESEDYVFCHNDISQQNVIVDPESLKIAAIVDWEYAGFYPAYFESPFYQRLGPSAAIGDEEDDSKTLLEFLQAQSTPQT